MSQTTELIVGTVGRAHGLRGEVTVRPRTDFAEDRFRPGATLRTSDGRSVEVTGHRWQSGMLVLTLKGVADRSGAEALRGLDLWATVDLDATDDGEFHDGALVGLAVRAGGREVGRVVAVQHPPAQDLLVVRTDAGERLVPFVAALVPTVDVAAGFVEVVDLPGLLSDLEED
jgi:16S rRNA processing protein RimM